MPRILIVDDDMELCKLLKMRLFKEEYIVDIAHDGKSALTYFKAEKYELVVLDVMLPEIDGFNVLKIIRENSVVPVIMLTAKDQENDKIFGLRMGADDYLTKPFLINEFVERIRSHIRRYIDFNNSLTTKSTSLSFTGIFLDSKKREVYIDDKLIVLTPKEFDILYFLALHQKQVFTKCQIFESVWNANYSFDDNNITVHIQRLRSKIASEKYTFIHTIWGIGYKFDVLEK